jgi:hypothetical protein
MHRADDLFGRASVSLVHERGFDCIRKNVLSRSTQDMRMSSPQDSVRVLPDGLVPERTNRALLTALIYVKSLFIGIYATPPLYVMFQALREKIRVSARPLEKCKLPAE